MQTITTETTQAIYTWTLENHTSYDTESIVDWIEEYLLRSARSVDECDRRVTPSDRRHYERSVMIVYSTGHTIREKEPWTQYRTRLSLPEPKKLGQTAMEELTVKLNLALGEQVRVSASDFYSSLALRINQIFSLPAWVYTKEGNVDIARITLAEMESAEDLRIRVARPTPADVKKAKKIKIQSDLKERLRKQTRVLRAHTQAADFKLRQTINSMRVVQGTVSRCVEHQTAEEEVVEAREQLEETQKEMMELITQIRQMLEGT